jgi:hypothetical protein
MIERDSACSIHQPKNEGGHSFWHTAPQSELMSLKAWINELNVGLSTVTGIVVQKQPSGTNPANLARRFIGRQITSRMTPYG